MITPIRGERVWEYYGLSTDTKPTTGASPDWEVPNGSSFLEMDTGDVYLYDADGNTWHKQ